MISIIIPTLNEAQNIACLLEQLQALRLRGHEVILVDAGSQDRTQQIAASYCDKVLIGTKGRAMQMNHGAKAAAGDILWFVHADSSLPENCDGLIQAAISGKTFAWGRFDIKLSGRCWLFRIIERMMNLRTRATAVVTGDHGLFMHKALFVKVQGFASLPLMEDIELSKRLRKISWPIAIPQRLQTSSRRWSRQGIFVTVLRMWTLRAAYFFGVHPRYLARWYG